MASLEQSAVAAILDRLPDTRHVAGVRGRDGSVEPFAPEQVGLAFSEALTAAGIQDDVLLARCTHDALTRIAAAYGVEALPSQDDVDHIVAGVLIEHDMLFAARERLLSSVSVAKSAATGNGKGLRFRRRFTRADAPTAAGAATDAFAASVADAGRASKYFSTDDDAASFQAELSHLLASGTLAFAPSSGEPLPSPAAAVSDDVMRRIAEGNAEARASLHGAIVVRFESAWRRGNTCPNSGTAFLLEPPRSATLDASAFCGGAVDVPGIVHAVEIAVTALDIAVGSAQYPTPAAERRGSDFRAIALRIGGIGSSVVRRSLAADSEKGRTFASALAALCTGRAYAHSARIAAALGPCDAYELNERPFLKVIGTHRDRAYALTDDCIPEELQQSLRAALDQALEGGMGSGFRNATVTAIVEDALDLRMAASLQTFVSGVVPATVALAASAAPEETEDAVVQGWKLGLKEMRIVRTAAATVTAQPMATVEAPAVAAPTPAPTPAASPDANERASITHHFTLGGHRGVLIVGVDASGRPVEVFVRLSKGGPMITGLLDAFAASASVALRHGVSPDALVEAHADAQFVPSGATAHAQIPEAVSVADYVSRWLAWRFR